MKHEEQKLMPDGNEFLESVLIDDDPKLIPRGIPIQN